MLRKFNRRNSGDLFQGIVEGALGIVLLIDWEGLIIYNNPSFARKFGYEPAEVMKRRFLDFVHEDDRFSMEEGVRKLIASGEEGGRAVLEFRFRHKDGQWLMMEMAICNLLKNEKVRAMLLTLRDAAGQKLAEKEVGEYRAHLEELVDLRTRALRAALEKEKTAVDQQRTFVSMISHEFRTPLTIIDGNAQIIQSRGSSLEQEVLERRANSIRGAVDRMVGLIETILSMNVLDSGKLPVKLAPCDLMKIIRDVCIERLDIAPNHKIMVDVQRGLPKVMLDEKAIHHVMVNIVSNAVKYSPRDSLIEVKAFREWDNIIIQVTDHGVGIPESELPKISTRYFRASTSSGIAGTGMGLYLVRQLVELHNGKLNLQSELGMGTTVTVELPIVPAS